MGLAAENKEYVSDYGGTPDSERQIARVWALRLFGKSPLKQRKLSMIQSYLGTTESLRCMDIGSDNGVISLLLRKAGGSWYSTDLNPETVNAIQTLVSDNVLLFDGRSIDFPDNYFDKIVIVDFLEHIEHDEACIAELHRIMKPGGDLIINVPNPKNGLIRKLRYALGQTDEVHGHVRPGYDINAISKLCDEKFYINEFKAYGKVFSELCDTLITGAIYALKGKKHSNKGAVVTGSDINKMQKSFKLFSIVYPVIALFCAMDKWLPFGHGNMLIVKARCSK